MAKKVSSPASHSAEPKERLDLEALPMPSVDHSTALASAKTVATRLAEPKTRRRFDAQPDDAVDRTLINAYFALRETANETSANYLSADNAESDASVPLSSVQVLTRIRTRVYNLVDYHLGDDPEVARELTVIRAGQGYKDLVDDVIALLKLREKHIVVLKGDKKNFRTDDATEGPEHCDIVRTARLKGQRPATRKAGRAWATAFYALREAHEEVITIGRFLDRKRPDVDTLWPSLYVNVKKAARPKGTGGGGEGV